MIPPTAATSPVDASPVSDAPDAPAPRRVGSGDPDRRRLSLLVASHGVDDFYQGAIPALVPFLTAAHALTFAQAGGLVFAVNVLSSVLQPLLGWWADRRSRPWLIALGLVCVSSGIALAVLAPTYRLALAALVLTGIGVAAYHPEATRAVHHAAGAKRGTAMSLFALGGNLGFALGPVLVVPVATAFGMRAVAWLALPAFAVAALMLARAPRRRA
nr:MFS transporter [Gemmatimonadaceae bacterium]